MDDRSPDGGTATAIAPKVLHDECTNNDERVSSGLDASTLERPHAKRDEAWEARRRHNNLRRREKAKAVHKARVATARAVVEAALAAMTPEQLDKWRAVQEAERADRIAAEAAQANRVAMALARGGPDRGPDAALRIAIDCSFAPSAPAKEMRSLCKQIEISSAVNKRHPRPACLTLTHWGEPLASAAAPCGAAGWRVVKLVEGPAEAFGPDRVVVLSPDALEPLLSVDSEHAYVIGGIVDRTHRKGLTLKFAEAQQMECRRLPIAEHAEALGLGKGTRKCPVLNIDDVVRALLVYNHTRNWVAALDGAIPSRKRKPQTMGFTTQPRSQQQQKQQQRPGAWETEDEEEQDGGLVGSDGVLDGGGGGEEEMKQEEQPGVVACCGGGSKSRAAAGKVESSDGGGGAARSAGSGGGCAAGAAPAGATEEAPLDVQLSVLRLNDKTPPV